MFLGLSEMLLDFAVTLPVVLLICYVFGSMFDSLCVALSHV